MGVLLKTPDVVRPVVYQRAGANVTHDHLDGVIMM